MKILLLEQNNISLIDAKSFQDLESLEELYLNENKLTSLKTDMFTYLESLKELHLKNCSIKTIEPESFNNLFKLIRLHLGHNFLFDLKRRSFDGLEAIEYIDLADNRLSTLSPDLFLELPRHLEIIVEGNPMKCDDDLCWVEGERDAGTMDLKPHCVCSQWKPDRYEVGKLIHFVTSFRICNCLFV